MFSRFAASRSATASVLAFAGIVAACSVAGGAPSPTPGGQAPKAAEPVAVVIPCDAFAAQSALSRDVTVPVGQRIAVTVCSNPSTGFSWLAASVPTDLVRLAEQAAAGASTAADAEPVVGAPGTETLTFEATAAGTGDVGMQYSQPWNGGTKGAWQLTLHVVVA